MKVGTEKKKCNKTFRAYHVTGSIWTASHFKVVQWKMNELTTVAHPVWGTSYHFTLTVKMHVHKCVKWSQLSVSVNLGHVRALSDVLLKFKVIFPYELKTVTGEVGLSIYWNFSFTHATHSRRVSAADMLSWFRQVVTPMEEKNECCSHVAGC